MPTLDTSSNGTEDGTSMYTHTSGIEGQVGDYVFEMLMPFTSGDADHDLSLGMSFLAGMKIGIMDGGSNSMGLLPIVNDIFEADDASTYATLHLQPRRPTTTHPNDINVNEGEYANISISWNLASSFSQGTYRILLDGSEVDNVVVTTDPAENVKPDKSKSTERIDGVVAAIMAFDRLTRKEPPSVYEDRGIISI